MVLWKECRTEVETWIGLVLLWRLTSSPWAVASACAVVLPGPSAAAVQECVPRTV